MKYLLTKENLIMNKINIKQDYKLITARFRLLSESTKSIYIKRTK